MNRRFEVERKNDKIIIFKVVLISSNNTFVDVVFSSIDSSYFIYDGIKCKYKRFIYLFIYFHL